MGRQSRKHRQRREARAAGRCPDRTTQLEQELMRLTGGDAILWTSDSCPPDVRESNLEDVLAFESVGKGTSLFDGLQGHGMDLPHPDKLDEEQSARKVMEVLSALEELSILLIGFEHMTASQFYRTLWHQTLWEGCYVKKRNPGAITIIDVSRSISKSEVLKLLDQALKASIIQ